MATKDISDTQVVQAFSHARSMGIFADSVLIQRTGQPEKVVYRAMERAERRGLIECGVSLRSGWLTDLGVALLNKCKTERDK